MIGYVVWETFLDSRRFGALSVEGQTMRINMDGRSQTSAYGARKTKMPEWDQPVVHRAHTAMDVPYLRDRDEPDFC